jgi:CHAT domain-containing protein
VESLVQAFWRAGTPQVVASRWNVDAAITTRIFSDFYTQLLADRNAPESLRCVAEAIRKTNPHPYFWAAFHVFGARPDRKKVTYDAATQRDHPRHLGH